MFSRMSSYFRQNLLIEVGHVEHHLIVFSLSRGCWIRFNQHDPADRKCLRQVGQRAHDSFKGEIYASTAAKVTLLLSTASSYSETRDRCTAHLIGEELLQGPRCPFKKKSPHLTVTFLLTPLPITALPSRFQADGNITLKSLDSLCDLQGLKRS